MIREIYTRQSDDPNFVGNIIETSDRVEKILAKVRMILGTKHGDIIGDYNFGVDLERMVFMSSESQQDIEKEINDQFQLYMGADPKYKVSAKVNFGHHADGYDYAVVDVYVNDMRIQGFMVD